MISERKKSKNVRHDQSRGAETLASSAYEKLRFDITVGVFEAGKKLLIRELCMRYGIGLSPIREALNRVSRDGLVLQNDQRGFIVAPLSEDDLEDLTKARSWANEAALRDAIANGDQAWEERIVIAFHRMSRLRGPFDSASESVNPEWEQAHRYFHSALLSACGSMWLLGFCDKLFDAADRYRFIGRRIYPGNGVELNPGNAEGGRHAEDIRRNPRNEHEEIMDAVIRRDADSAVGLLTRHFAKTLEVGRLEIRRLTAASQKQKAKKKTVRKAKDKIKSIGDKSSQPIV